MCGLLTDDDVGHDVWCIEWCLGGAAEKDRAPGDRADACGGSARHTWLAFEGGQIWHAHGLHYFHSLWAPELILRT